MSQKSNASVEGQPLPRNVKVLGAASLMSDVASEMIFPLMPQFLITVPGGNRFHLGIIEGVADSTDPLIQGRAFGYHRAMDHLRAAIGPIPASLFLQRGSTGNS